MQTAPRGSRRLSDGRPKRNSEQRNAAHRTERTATALALLLVEAGDQRPGCRQCPLQRYGAARILADPVAHLAHPALAFALLADRRAQRGFDRTPMLQLLAGETERGAQPRDLALRHDDVLRRSRGRAKSMFRNQ